MAKVTASVHKFTSCDGCQLAFLTAGEDLLGLSEHIEWLHFAEAGFIDADAKVDIAFVEGSISTPHEIERIETIRQHSQFLITIGACATAGGLQALRNAADINQWMAGVYANPEHIQTLVTSQSIASYVKVDAEIWGCPVNTEQVLAVTKSLLAGAEPQIKHDSVCIECKRQGQVCVMVSQGIACMGPVTQLGCGAICPKLGRGCFGCYGPQQNPNTQALGERFRALGLSDQQIGRHFNHINNQAEAFAKASHTFKGIAIVQEQKS